LILSAKHARNELIHIEYLTEEQLDRLGRRYSKVAATYQDSLRGSVEGAMPVGGVPDRSGGQSDLLQTIADHPSGCGLVGGDVLDTPAVGTDSASDISCGQVSVP
jgi:hypothetical protein